MLSTRRLSSILLAVFLLLAAILFLNSGSTATTLEKLTRPKTGGPKHPQQPQPPTPPKEPAGPIAVSYDKTTPPTVGCESIVADLQRRLIEAYQQQLRGIRYANIYGYLETENKGDAAIWSAQQILLSTLGIDSMEACRFLDKGCDLARYKAQLDAHKPYSAILMAGGGNFNDYYTTDHPSRLAMVREFRDTPIRAFPQSIYMTKDDSIRKTEEIFGAHSDLQLAARDRPSFDWLQKTFGPHARGTVPDKVRHILTPDVAFMFGNRPDFRLNTKKTHQILILARDDMEIAEGDSRAIPMGTGSLFLGAAVGNVTYNKVDWKFTKTPGIDAETVVHADGTKTTTAAETGKNQRAWAKAMQGFEMLGSVDLVITDRLHGHIMSTIIGVPHILMDSKLKKNLNFHDTWTKDCACTRVAANFNEAKHFAQLFFEQQRKDKGGKE